MFSMSLSLRLASMSLLERDRVVKSSNQSLFFFALVMSLYDENVIETTTSSRSSLSALTLNGFPHHSQPTQRNVLLNFLSRGVVIMRDDPISNLMMTQKCNI